MGRPPIGKRAMTPAERQRRHRRGLSSRDTKPVPKPPVTKPPEPVTKPTKLPETGGAIPLLSSDEIEQFADELEINPNDLNRLMQLQWRRDLEFWNDDPEEMARTLLQQLGYGALLDIWEAIGK